MQYSVVNYSDVLKDNELFRIDSDFFRIDYLVSENKIKAHSWNYLGDIASRIINFGAYSLTNYIIYLDKGVPFLNVGDIKENCIDYENSKKIDSKLSENILNKSLCKESQVLLTIAGTIGKAAVVYKAPAETNSNQAIANIDVNKISPFFLSVYLNCFFGKQQTKRLTISSVQPNLLLTQVKKIKVPIFSSDFQIIIEKLYKYCYELTKKGHDFYNEAESTILSEVGLLGWNPKRQLAFVEYFSDTKKDNRFDAEYFQPEYEDIINIIKKHKGGIAELGHLAKMEKSVEPGSEAYQESGIPFIRVSNISKYEISNNNQQFISDELYEELKSHQPKKGEILLSKDATPGIAYFLNEEPQRMIVSSGILRLKIDNKKILPEYLTLVLNSAVVQKQIERDTGGSIINHWRPDQVKATLIPILKEDKQKEIKELIEKSFSDRKSSKSLLEIAKQGVEIAIENNEATAKDWISDELKKIGIII